MAETPSNYHEIPVPDNEAAGRNHNNRGQLAITKAAKFYRPGDAPHTEPEVSTVSRFAARLIDRLTGKAYTADGLRNWMNSQSRAGSRFNLVLEGDSRVSNAYGTNSTTWAQKFLAAFRPNIGVLANVGSSGTTMATILTQYSAQIAPYKPSLNNGTPCIAYLAAGVNDLNTTSKTAAEIFADISAWWALAKADGFIVIGATVAPSTQLDAGEEARRVALNDLIVAATARYDILDDVSANFPDATNALLYEDGTHLNEYGSALQAAYFAADIAAYLPASSPSALPLNNFDIRVLAGLTATGVCMKTSLNATYGFTLGTTGPGLSVQSGSSIARLDTGGIYVTSFCVNVINVRSAANISFGCSAAPGTGMYIPAAGQVGLSTSGVSRLLVTDTRFTISNRPAFSGVASYADNAAALAAGLTAGDVYRTSTGELRIVI